MKQLRGTPLRRFLRNLPPPPSPADLVVVCQSVAYPINVGSIFRIGDALGVAEIVLTGITPTPPHPTVTKVGRDKDRRVPWRSVKEPEAPLEGLRANGFWIAGPGVTGGNAPHL